MANVSNLNHSPPIQANPPGPQSPLTDEDDEDFGFHLLPLPVQKGVQFTVEVIGGGVTGYVSYWIMRLTPVLMSSAGSASVAIRPLPYIFSGMASVALMSAMCLTYRLALAVLGNRSDDGNLPSQQGTFGLDGLRKYAWKAITEVEKLQSMADEVYSSLFNIRTVKQIRENYHSDTHYYLSDPSFMEVMRRVFVEQVCETFQSVLPQELGVSLVEVGGYKVEGREMLIPFYYGLEFVNGLMQKTTKVYSEIRKREIAEIKKRKEEEKKEDLIVKDVGSDVESDPQGPDLPAE